MGRLLIYFAAVLCMLVIPTYCASVLKNLMDTSKSCEKFCSASFSDIDLATACNKGCRLFTIIGLAKDSEKDSNATEHSCLSACQESYRIGPNVKACDDGCKNEASIARNTKDNTKTLHLLTPLMYVKSAYRSVVHHVKQLVTTSFTLYIEEDTGKMVVLQTNPKTIIDGIDSNSKSSVSDAKVSSPTWQAERSDWMDCISQQSGLPRWILVSVLFGFIVALLWLCCVTTVTAPNHHVSSNMKKFTTKNDIGYLYLYEPVDKYQIQPPADVQAPPLPEKVRLA